MEIPSHVTVSDYLDILQSLLLINNLYQVNLGKRLPVFRKERKCYFLDPFLYSVFKGYTQGRYKDYSEGFEDRLLEGVVCETLARFDRRGLDTDHFLWYFLKKETNFVVKAENKLVGIELKWQTRVDNRDFNNFYSFDRRILLSRDSFSYENGLLTIPASIFLSLCGD